MSSFNKGHVCPSSMACHRVSHDTESPKQCRMTSTASTFTTEQQIGSDNNHELANQFKHLKVNKKHTTKSSIPASISTPSMHTESLADEELVERLKDIIHEFMTRPDRHYVYNTTMRWNIDHCNEIKYNVVISIRQPEDST